jgi:hypothetical protein
MVSVHEPRVTIVYRPRFVFEGVDPPTDRRWDRATPSDATLPGRRGGVPALLSRRWRADISATSKDQINADLLAFLKASTVSVRQPERVVSIPFDAGRFLTA